MSPGGAGEGPGRWVPAQLERPEARVGGSFGGPGAGCVSIVLPSICLRKEPVASSALPMSFVLFLLSLLLNSKPWEDLGCPACYMEHGACYVVGGAC